MRNTALRLVVRVALPLIALVVLLVALPVYGDATASSRLTPAMQADLSKDLPYYSVIVTMNFHPQYFNLQQLQSIGTLAGVGAKTVKVLLLTASQVRQIAAYYWVTSVGPLNAS
jgi:hypothetical protein